MITKLTKLQLLSPFPIHIKDVGNVISPTLEQLLELGEEEYLCYIFLISMTPEKYFETIHAQDVYEKFTAQEKKSISMFELLTTELKNIDFLLKALSFFFIEKIVLSKNVLLLIDKNTDKVQGEINKNNFDDICKIILQLNFREVSEYERLKPKNDIASDILEKLKKGESLQNKEVIQNICLENIISAMCVQHNSYNMLNIWSLTVYQLYDQFFRQNIKLQLDISSIKWAAYGTEQFDFSLWFKSNKN